MRPEARVILNVCFVQPRIPWRQELGEQWFPPNFRTNKYEPGAESDVAFLEGIEKLASRVELEPAQIKTLSLMALSASEIK